MHSWQKNLTSGFRHTHELLAFLNLPTESGIEDAANEFALRVPRAFAQKMQKGNRQDPLLLQVLPQAIEMQTAAGFSEDPLEEKKANKAPGLIHKYQGRVLVTLAGACAINCRYCFRRHFPYQDNNPGAQGLKKILQYISEDASIEEIIFSGGDPLIANDNIWQNIVENLSEIPHVTTIRIHSRIPVVLPERITADWLDILANTRLHKVLVIHSNHPNELDAQIAEKITAFKAMGGTVLNQSVLLKNVNDNIDTLVNLSHKLFAIGVLPYYLHVLDKVKGSAHFDIPLEMAKKLHTELRGRLPGYLVPKLAKEEAGAIGKTWL